MSMIAQYEEHAHNMLRIQLGIEKLLLYKVSYNFRFMTANGTYKLFNHQSLLLEVDENGMAIKAINIHTQIDHLVKEHNNTYSLIGLCGEPSYFNIDVKCTSEETACKTSSQHYLSKREIQVIQLLSKGSSNIEIAEQLFISPNTVKNHRKKILQKANCKNVRQLIAKCMAEGLI